MEVTQTGWRGQDEIELRISDKEDRKGQDQIELRISYNRHWAKSNKKKSAGSKSI